jgi:L-alanine-DL-glutamate epimerase-like enolase superfamily enzyme
MITTRSSARIESLSASAFRIPTDAPESDGTIEWSSTTLVIVEATAADVKGLGYSYSDASITRIVDSILRPTVVGCEATATATAYDSMVRSVRNLGRPGLASTAISAVDVALWDLKARLLGVSLVGLLGASRTSIAAYGSGGFTSYDDARLAEQLGRWVETDGCGAVKMKIGRAPHRDRERVRVARAAIGDAAELFVDANGAYDRKQALAFGEAFAPLGVTWFEEPVSSDDLEGLKLLRDRLPPGMRVAIGEYGYDATYFRRLLAADACDVLQADATRCGGITGFMKAAALAEAWHVPLSAHTAPSLHATLCCAAGPAINVEYFHDHARIERMLFDGARDVRGGCLVPDLSRPGLGLEFKRSDAERFVA